MLLSFLTTMCVACELVESLANCYALCPARTRSVRIASGAEGTRFRTPLQAYQNQINALHTALRASWGSLVRSSSHAPMVPSLEDHALRTSGSVLATSTAKSPAPTPARHRSALKFPFSYSSGLPNIGLGPTGYIPGVWTSCLPI